MLQYPWIALFLMLYMFLWKLWGSLLGHMTQMLVLGFDWWGEKPCYRRISPLAVVEIWTQVLADSMAIAASALNHYVTWTIYYRCAALPNDYILNIFFLGVLCFKKSKAVFSTNIFHIDNKYLSITLHVFTLNFIKIHTCLH